MIKWRGEHIALLSRYYRERVLKVATTEGYLEANREIGRAAGVTGRTVELWITGEREPTPEQGERLVQWVATLRDDVGRDVGIAETLTELINADKQKEKGSKSRVR